MQPAREQSVPTDIDFERNLNLRTYDFVVAKFGLHETQGLKHYVGKFSEVKKDVYHISFMRKISGHNCFFFVFQFHMLRGFKKLI